MHITLCTIINDFDIEEIVLDLLVSYIAISLTNN